MHRAGLRRTALFGACERGHVKAAKASKQFFLKKRTKKLLLVIMYALSQRSRQMSMRGYWHDHQTACGGASAGHMRAGGWLGRQPDLAGANHPGPRRRAASVARGLGAAGLLLAFLVQLLVAICGVLPASVGAFSCGMAYGIGAGFVNFRQRHAAGGRAGLSAQPLPAAAADRPHAGPPPAHRPAGGRGGARWLAAGGAAALLARDAVRRHQLRLRLTSIRLRAYLLGSLAALPALLGYVVLGALTAAGLAQARAGEARSVHAGLLVLAIAATALLTWRVRRHHQTRHACGVDGCTW